MGPRGGRVGGGSGGGEGYLAVAALDQLRSVPMLAQEAQHLHSEHRLVSWHALWRLPPQQDEHLWRWEEWQGQSSTQHDLDLHRSMG